MSITEYRVRMQLLGGYDGNLRRQQSQKIMDASWMRDAATKPVYVKWVNKGLPVIDDNDIPVYAKFNVKSYHNITGDEIAYLLQFRLEDMRENPDIKVGSYVSIENEMGEPEWWMIVHFDDRTQFRQFSILKCTHVYKWVSFKDGHRIVYEALGVTRTQSNYNSGVWLDYRFETIEQQHIMILPINYDSNIVSYNTKFLISNEGRYPPLAWKISKVAPKITGGVVYFTMTQEQFNPATDNADLMIADYYQTVVEPIPELTVESDDLQFVYSGYPAVKAGGSYKKFTLKHIVNDISEDILSDVVFTVTSDDFDISELTYMVEKNIIKIKCNSNYLLIGKTFTISADTEYGVKSVVCEVISI